MIRTTVTGPLLRWQAAAPRCSRVHLFKVVTSAPCRSQLRPPSEPAFCLFSEAQPGLGSLSLQPFSRPWGLLAGSPGPGGLWAPSVFPFAACPSAVGRAVWLSVPVFLSSVSGKEVSLLYTRVLDRVDGPARALLPGWGETRLRVGHTPLRGQEGGCRECSAQSSWRYLRFAECPVPSTPGDIKSTSPPEAGQWGERVRHKPFPEKVLTSPRRQVSRGFRLHVAFHF